MLQFFIIKQARVLFVLQLALQRTVPKVRFASIQSGQLRQRISLLQSLPGIFQFRTIQGLRQSGYPLLLLQSKIEKTSTDESNYEEYSFDAILLVKKIVVPSIHEND
jgi:hypothetical protein